MSTLQSAMSQNNSFINLLHSQCLIFDQIHINIVICPLSISGGFTYLLTCVDRFTHWPEAIPLTCITTDSVAKAFVGGCISRFGVPSTITTDRGWQFESSLWTSLMHHLRSTRCRTTAYHPSANGLVERFHRQLKGAGPNNISLCRNEQQGGAA